MSMRRLAGVMVIAALVSLCVWGAAPPSEKTGWPWNSLGGSPGGIAVGDVDYNGDLEVVFTVYESGWKLYILHHDGTALAGWPISDTSGIVSLGDVDSDGTLEICVALEGAGGYWDRLRCYKSDGTILWTVQANCCFRSFRVSAIADVDLDGTLDVFSIAADDGDQADEAYLLHGATGAKFTGWPPPMSGYGRTVFSLTDLDGDNDLEMLIAVSGQEAFHHDGTVVAGYPKAKGVLAVVADVNGDGIKEHIGKESSISVGIYDMDVNPLTGWPQITGNTNILPSVCDMNDDGILETAIAVTGPEIYFFQSDGTPVPGWPVLRGNFGSGDQTLIGDTDGDGLLNFINGATEQDISPDGKVFNYRQDGALETDFPWDFPFPTNRFGGTTGVLVDLDLDGIVDLGMPSEQEYQLHFWSLGTAYNPLNMHWRTAGGNMQHTGEWHPPSYYVPTVTSLSPALTWVTSCPVGTLECSGASFESKPFVWFVPSADAPDFYGGDLSKGIPAVAVAQPQIHPVSGTPQNPLNATYIEVAPPALAIGSYELVIQNPTGIRNMVKPVITVTDDENASVAPVGDTLMVNFGPSDGELSFDWGDVGNTEYVVIYDTAPDGTFSSEAGQTTTNNLITESPAGSDLFFRVVGVNSCGYGP